MKTRQGFVSNSSSSSFIVAFKDMPESAEDVQKILFGDVKVICEYEHIGAFSTLEIAGVVFEDMVGQKSRSLAEIHSKLSGGYEGDYDADFDPEANKKTTDKQYKEKIGSFANDLEDKLVFFFEYSDNDGALYTTMEHGGIFNNLPNRRISHH